MDKFTNLERSGKRHQFATSVCLECYWLVISYMEVRPPYDKIKRNFFQASDVCCIVSSFPTKNINKDNERTSMNERNTLLYKNIYLSFYSRKAHTVCCKFEREMERHTLRERTFSCSITSPWSLGVLTLAPTCKPYRQRHPRDLWLAVYPWLDSRFWLAWMTNSDRVVLISRGFLPVTHLIDWPTSTGYPPVY